MAEAIEEANQGLTRTLKDLFGGAVGGVAQVLIGMLTQSLCVKSDRLCTSKRLWVLESAPTLRPNMRSGIHEDL